MLSKRKSEMEEQKVEKFGYKLLIMRFANYDLQNIKEINMRSII